MGQGEERWSTFALGASTVIPTKADSMARDMTLNYSMISCFNPGVLSLDNGRRGASEIYSCTSVAVLRYRAYRRLAPPISEIKHGLL